MIRLAAIFGLCAATLAIPLPRAAAQSSGANTDQAAVAALERTLVDVIHASEPSVVAIGRTPPPTQQSLLTPPAGDLFANLRQQTTATEPNIVAAGVIINSAGLVLTEYLAVREGEQQSVTTVDGKTYPAAIKAADPRSGLAVLAITGPANSQPAGNSDVPINPSQFKSIPFGDASQLRKGQFVIAIGNPYAIRSDGEPTASWGIVSNLARKAPSGANLNDTPGPNGDYRTTLHHLGTLIQTDAKLGWGAGGGALVNLHGELVGLTTTIATIAGHEQPAGYAIPIDEPTRRIIDTLKLGREVEYGLLGIGFQPRNPEALVASPIGATVQQVYPASPAAHAGFQTGDIITRVANQAITDVDQLQLAVSRLAPSQQIRIDYRHAGREATYDVTLSKLPVPGKKIVTDRPPDWRGIRVDYPFAFDAANLSEQATSGALDPDGCVVVSEVASGSPAWKAGIRPGMFISHVSDRRVTTPDEFRAAVQDAGGNLNLRLTQPLRQQDAQDGKDVQIAPAE